MEQHRINVLCLLEHKVNDGLMFAQRRRRWANINPALIQSVPFAGDEEPIRIGNSVKDSIYRPGSQHPQYRGLKPCPAELFALLSC